MSSPYRQLRPRDLGLDPRAVGIQDARQPAGGLAGTVAGVARGLGQSSSVQTRVSDTESLYLFGPGVIELPHTEVTLTGLTGTVIAGPERIAQCRATFTGFGDAAWGGITWGAVEVTRSIRLTSGDGTHTFPWLVGGIYPGNNTLPNIRLAVEGATSDGSVSLSIVVPNA